MRAILTATFIAALAFCAPSAHASDFSSQAAPSVAREFPRTIAPSKIILVGDSTTAVVGGWGPSFCAHHVTSFAACLDLARGGRSSRTYMQEGSWNIALSEARTTGYAHVWVLIQFGHNDQPGNSRSTELEQEFPGYIRRYVEDVRAAGAVPVLVTPLVRRTFDEGRIVNDLEPWAEAIRRVAAETGAELIDLNALSLAAIEALGPTQAERFAQLPRGSSTNRSAPPRAQTEVNVQPTGSYRLSSDDTHLGEEGADYIAAIMARALADKIGEIRPLLILDRRPDRRAAQLRQD